MCATTQVLNDPRSTGSLVPEKEFKRARSYPLQSLPEVQNLQSWQTRSEEHAAALAKIPASLTDVWKDLDIESEGTWLPTVSRMISDVIRNQLYKEGFTDEDWELDRARSRRARKGYTYLDSQVVPFCPFCFGLLSKGSFYCLYGGFRK